MGLTRFLVTMAVVATCSAQEASSPTVTGGVTVQIGGRWVPYRVVDGYAIVFGDIVVGRVEEFERSKPAGRRHDAVIVSDTASLWPNATVPYVMDAGVTAAVRDRFGEAAAYWAAETPVRFVPRTTESSYVRVRQLEDMGSCSAYAWVGRGTGETVLALSPSCSLDVFIHEMGHTVGLWHEQSRHDRDRYVEVFYGNLDKSRLADFNTKILHGADDGPYDFASLMQYTLYDGTRNGRPTMRTLPPGLTVRGDRLSPGDIDAVRRLYGRPPTSVTVTTNPPGLQIIVNGQRLTSPQTFGWTPGSSHTLSVPSPQGAGDTRYVFGRWSNDGPQTQTITVSATTYTAHMIRQCKVSFYPGPDAVAGSYTVSPLSPDDYYDCDSEITLHAVPAARRTFQSWNWPDLASKNPVTFRVTTSRGAVNPTFTDRPMVTINTSPPGLRVMVDGVMTWTPRNYVWAPGSRHTLTAPDQREGLIAYLFSGWSQGGAASQTIVAPEGSATYVASYRTRYRLTSTVIGTGSVTASPASEDGYYDAGARVQLTAQPAASFRFWTGDATGTGNPHSVVMDDERRVVAHFIAAAAPAISALMPSSVVAGTAPLVLNVSGHGFYEGLTQVFWNGVARPFRVVSSGEIQIPLTAQDLSAPGQAALRISSPGFSDATAVFTVTAPPPNCSYVLSDAGVSLGSYGGTATVGVQAGSGCAWSAVSEASWVEVIPPPRSPGSGTLNLWVAPNASAEGRSGTVRVGGQAVTISQAGAPCKATLAPPSISVSASGGGGSVVLILLVGDCRWTASSSADWLKLTSPVSGTGSGVISYTVEPNPDQSARIAEIRVAGQRVAVSQQAAGGGSLAAVSSASFAAGAALAPNSLGAAFGQGLARQVEVASTTPLPSVLAGTRLVFRKPDGSFIASALVFVSPQQINFVVPPLPEGPTLMVATIDEKPVASGVVQIERVAPGLFSANANGRGTAAAVALKVAADATQTSQLTFRCGATPGSCVSVPIDLGAEADRVILLLFGTGIRHHGGLERVSVTVGGVSAPVLYAGPQGEFAGLDQINVQLPRGLAGRGELDVVLRVEDKAANVVTVNIK